ncbi:MAG: NAD(P)H-dependent glycerol-3-phosphate dehydrogenase [Rhodospirillales bacterium]|nr:NAD(P)H-dependent glycerol-3-phosphate dehydrogenase [Rhodospirillales bacterium]
MSEVPAADVLVVGAGAWGTALAIHAASSGRSVRLWARDPARAAAIEAARENPRLPGVRLPAAIRVAATMAAADLVLLAVPVAHLAATAAWLPDAPVLVCAKGFEVGTLRLPLETLAAIRPDLRAGVLTGPNFAGEIARGLPGASVVAATDAGLRREAMRLLSGGALRLYGNADAIGAQVGGAAKNVIAIAAGAAIGAGFGENARAALVTRGLAEIARLALALGGRATTVAGLSGLGDLVLTCTGAASRNFALGLALGRGATPAQAMAGHSHAVEGAASAAPLLARAAAAGVEMPICEEVAGLLAGKAGPAEALRRLLSRTQTDE